MPVDIIEPCGFALGDRTLRRAALDYVELATLKTHASWAAFLAARPPGRLVLLSTKAALPHVNFAFRPEDTLLLGQESAGVPDAVRAAVDASVRIVMAPGRRSLNVALAAALVLGEALRQTGQYPIEAG